MSSLFEVQSVKYQLLVFDASLVLLVAGVIEFLPVLFRLNDFELLEVLQDTLLDVHPVLESKTLDFA